MNKQVLNNVAANISPSIEKLLHTIEPIILSGVGLMIVGEKGTERELLASSIHALSGRGKHDFSTFYCGNNLYASLEKIIYGTEDLTLTGIEINKGVLENSIPGSLFIENVDNFSKYSLNRLIRNYQNGYFRRIGGVEDIPLNVRFIGGIDQDSINESRREFHEILRQLFPIIVNFSPLRERKDDLLFYLEKMIEENNSLSSNRLNRISDEFMRFILEYSWPGNLVEFQNVMRYALSWSRGRMICLNHLPSNIFHDSAQRIILPVNSKNELN